MLEWRPTISFVIGSVFCLVFPLRACCNLSEDCIYTSGFFCRSERRTNKPRTDRRAHNAEKRRRGGGRDRRRTGYGENKAGVLWQLRVRCTPVGNRAHVHQLREGGARWHEDRHVFSFFSVSLSALLFFSCACRRWSSTLFVTSLVCLFALFCALWRAFVLLCEGQMGAVFVCVCVCTCASY
jgi:hypothetical protein